MSAHPSFMVAGIVFGNALILLAPCATGGLALVSLVQVIRRPRAHWIVMLILFGLLTVGALGTIAWGVVRGQGDGAWMGLGAPLGQEEETRSVRARDGSFELDVPVHWEDNSAKIPSGAVLFAMGDATEESGEILTIYRPLPKRSGVTLERASSHVFVDLHRALGMEPGELGAPTIDEMGGHRCVRQRIVHRASGGTAIFEAYLIERPESFLKMLLWADESRGEAAFRRLRAAAASYREVAGEGAIEALPADHQFLPPGVTPQ